MRKAFYVWQEWPLFFRGIGRVRYQLARYSSGMADAQIEHADDRVYFTNTAGQRWRLHDVAFGPPHTKPHHYRRFAIGDQRATSRVFVSAWGERRSYRFVRGETRALSPESCEVQLARAGYLAESKLDARGWTDRK